MPDELHEKMLKLVHFMKKEILSARRKELKGANALLDRVEGGEEIIIAKSGRPVARLVPLKAKVKKAYSRDSERPDYNNERFFRAAARNSILFWISGCCGVILKRYAMQSMWRQDKIDYRLKGNYLQLHGLRQKIPFEGIH